MYSAIERQTMILTVRESIRHGLHMGTPIRLDLSEYGAALMENRACFITLKNKDELRGSMGSYNTGQSLIENIAYNAHKAAFKDPRFDPVENSEYSQLSIEISILTESESINFNTEQQLIEQLKPQIDGLILDDGERSATFLPTVWKQLPCAREFLNELKTKLCLNEEDWNPSITAKRFSAVIIRSA